MKKIKLHWQILFALILAIIFGLIFQTDFILRDSSFEKLKQKKVPEESIEKLRALENVRFADQKAFITEVEKIIGRDALKAHRFQIIKQAYDNDAIYYVSWMGDIFLRALKMLIIPLILSSIISAVANIGSGADLGRLGGKTFLYYISTSIIAIVTGQILVNIFRPGVGADLNFIQEVEGLATDQKSFREILIEIIPENIFQAFVQNQMLSIIFFAIIFGFFITRAGDKYKVLLTNFSNAVFDVMMQVTLFVIKFTPFGIFGIVAKVVADQDNLVALAGTMGKYMGVVLLGLFIHFVITLPLLVRYIANVNPLKHFRAVSTPLLTAFSTSSSGATLPLTMDAVEHNCGVSNKVTGFTIPLGATVNMDGTALYECVAALFIAQAYGIEISFMNQLVVVFTALLASVGAAAIPMAGLVMLTVILTAVNLPLEGIGLILAVDRILDMFRTATNCWSDTCGAVIIAKSEGESLKI